MIITARMRDVLIEHIDGGRPIVRGHVTNSRGDYYVRWRTVMALVERKLLRFDRPGHPHMTHMTEAGREALAEALGELADVLVRAGYEVNEKLSRGDDAPPPCNDLPTPSPAAAGPTVEQSARPMTQTGR